jgi:NAD(P)-dependent dehydrogenase (short-subunit alcohol dehydrogenase family)
MVEGKTALVTGAGSGIGQAAATALLTQGWNTVFVGRRLDRLEKAIAAAGETRGRALAVACDVGNPEQVDALFATVEAEFGRLDLLFNNAGMNPPGAPIDEIPVESWFEAVNVNLNGSFLCARAAFGLMRRQKPRGGRIINNGSISAHAPRPLSVPYTTTKHAITGLTRTLALAGGPYHTACAHIYIRTALPLRAARITMGVPLAHGGIAAEATMDVRHVADAVVHMAGLPLDANILFMTVMATKMPFVGRG